MPARLLFIDNIRWSIILLVLSMHASDTYSPFGNWYYTDRPPLSLGERVFFATYQSWLQAFFMALLFFVAACFAPASCDRKGAVRYVRDRFMRLVVPTLLYMFVIGPLTEYYISGSWTGGGFTQQWLAHVTDGEWVSGSGPIRPAGRFRRRFRHRLRSSHSSWPWPLELLLCVRSHQAVCPS
jgi:hypothetical protein